MLLVGGERAYLSFRNFPRPTMLVPNTTPHIMSLQLARDRYSCSAEAVFTQLISWPFSGRQFNGTSQPASASIFSLCMCTLKAAKK